MRFSIELTGYRLFPESPFQPQELLVNPQGVLDEKMVVVLGKEWMGIQASHSIRREGSPQSAGGGWF